MKLKKLGETGLIERLAKYVKGIGDDCAVIRISKKRYLLITIDMLLEDVDFKLKEATPYQIGWKSLACGLSDIASMGGAAKYAVVSLGLPGKLSVEFVDGLYRGIKALAKRFDVEIVGGDTNASKKLVIDVAVLGFIQPDRLTLRSGAKPGDIICVTGVLGGSYKSKRHLTFVPRLNEARSLVKNFRITSMIDISDGLSTDLNHIAKESGVGACVYEELIPLSKDAKNVSAALNEGEDFELLFTMPLREARRLARKGLGSNGVKITQIGEILDKKIGVKIIRPDGRVKDLKSKGFSHF
ncbi:MAG: thiamine-phosphate kinase [Omnitrophica WOR_2 bacterium RIFCSPLOWO2_02_FULL_50_19]|nr:MAG: thiamine-phosphate kinase [Omnitrophica WOR_2 bacterium RIFCSPLOWO2_02_FULL_50_19]